MAANNVTTKKVFKKRERWHYYAGLAMLCWLASLTLPVFVWSRGAPEYGWQVLAFGWCGFFAGNFAWIANILFLAAWFRVFKEPSQQAIKTALVAIVLGLDALMFTSINLEILEIPIYFVIGYGSGFVLWQISLILVFLASIVKSKQKINAEDEKDAVVGFLSRSVIFFADAVLLGVCAIIIVYSLTSFIQIKRIASDDEKERLNHAVVALEPLCTKNVPQITHPLPYGVYVVDYQDNQEPEKAMEMVKDLLASGVTAVQYSGKEFQLERLTHGELLMYFVSPVKTANLRVAHHLNEENGIRTLSIVDLKNNTVLFENEWEVLTHSIARLSGAAKECPQWTFYNPDRGRYFNVFESIVWNLLNGSEINQRHSRGWTKTLSNTYKGELKVKDLLTPSQLALLELDPLSDAYGCPADVGWLAKESGNERKTCSAKKHLRVHERTYYATFYSGNLYCTSEYLYFYRFYAEGKQGRLMIDKRHLNDLNTVWGGVVNFPFPLDRKDVPWYQLRVIALEESDSRLTLSLIDPATGFRRELKADLVSSTK